jgi:hypothetical protein
MAITLSGDGISSDAIASLAASKLTGTLPDANAPSGSVIQVVQGVVSGVSATSTTSSTFIDTGLTATITPISTSSKILVLINHGGCGKSGGNTGINYRLYRNGSQIQVILDAGFYNNSPTADSRFQVISSSYLDSPSTTSSITYKTQFANFNNGIGTVSVQDYGNTTIQSTITLLEIAG